MFDEINKKLKKQKKQRKNNDFENSDEEDDEEVDGEENVDADDNISASDTRSIDAKSKTELENNPQNSQNNNQAASTKVDQRIVVMFDRMKITIGEMVTQQQLESGNYEELIADEPQLVPHMSILEMIIEGLEMEFNNGKVQNLNLVMNRLYMKDLQRINKIQDDMILGSDPLIPDCFQYFLSNPDIEKEYREQSELMRSESRSIRTEEFKSIVGGDDEESVAVMQGGSQNITQLKLALKMENQTTSVEFFFNNLRMVVTLPILGKIS